MVADLFCDVGYAAFCVEQQMFGFFQADILQVSGIGKAGFFLDEPVEVIFLKMEYFH